MRNSIVTPSEILQHENHHQESFRKEDVLSHKARGSLERGRDSLSQFNKKSSPSIDYSRLKWSVNELTKQPTITRKENYANGRWTETPAGSALPRPPARWLLHSTRLNYFPPLRADVSEPLQFTLSDSEEEDASHQEPFLDDGVEDERDSGFGVGEEDPSESRQEEEWQTGRHRCAATACEESLIELLQRLECGEDPGAEQAVTSQDYYDGFASFCSLQTSSPSQF